MKKPVFLVAIFFVAQIGPSWFSMFVVVVVVVALLQNHVGILTAIIHYPGTVFTLTKESGTVFQWLFLVPIKGGIGSIFYLSGRRLDYKWYIHPRNLIWIPKMAMINGSYLFPTIISGIHPLVFRAVSGKNLPKKGDYMPPIEHPRLREPKKQRNFQLGS